MVANDNQNKRLPLLTPQNKVGKIEIQADQTNLSMTLDRLDDSFVKFFTEPFENLLKIFSNDVLDKLVTAPIPEKKPDENFIGPMNRPMPGDQSFIGPMPQTEKQKTDGFFEQIIESLNNINKTLVETEKKDKINEERDDRENKENEEEKRKKNNKQGFLSTLLNPQIGKDLSDKTGNLLSQLFLFALNPKLLVTLIGAKLVSKIVPLLSRAMFTPITAIISSIGYGLYDAFSKADIVGEMENVGGFTGGITQFLFGQASKGFMDKVAHLGKWAGMGALAGAVFGPPGMIAGAIIGAGIGAALDFVGGEAFADYLQRGVDRISTLNTLFFEGDESKVEEKRREVAKQIEDTNNFIRKRMEDAAAKASEITNMEGLLAQARLDNNGILVEQYTKNLEELRSAKEAIDNDIARENEKIEASKTNLELLSAGNYRERIYLALNKAAEYAVESFRNVPLTDTITVGQGVDAIHKYFRELDQDIINIYNSTNEWVAKKITDTQQYFTDIWNTFSNSIVTMKDNAIAWKNEKINNFNRMISDNLGFLFNSEFYLGHITSMQSMISDKISEIGKNVADLFSYEKLSTAITDLSDSILSSFTGFLNSIKDRVTGGLDNLKNKALNLVTFGYYGEEETVPPTPPEETIQGGEGNVGVTGNAGSDTLGVKPSIVSSDILSSKVTTEKFVDKIVTKVDKKVGSIDKNNYYDFEKGKVPMLQGLAVAKAEEKEAQKNMALTQAMQSYQNNMITTMNTNVTHNTYSGRVEVRDTSLGAYTRGAL